jgi:hypothetical protein
MVLELCLPPKGFDPRIPQVTRVLGESLGHSVEAGG